MAPGSTEQHRERECSWAHVLVVDDDDRLRHVLASVLGDEYLVDTARSSEEAMARLRSGVDFDLILTDIMMPGGSGIDLYESISHEFVGHALRVVFMTGDLNESLRRQLGRLPNAWLEKPFDLGELRRVLRDRILATRLRARRLAQAH